MTDQKVAELSTDSGSTQGESSRIVSALRSAISSGELSPGTKLQSENRLARSFGATVHSIRKALKELREEGVVYSVPKSGVFVSEPRQPLFMESDLSMQRGGRLYFVTLSFLRRQQLIFSSVFGRFHELPPFYEICCKNPGEDFNLSCLEEEGQADVVENSPFHYPRNRHLFLDIRKYFSGTLQTSEKDRCSVPFCYSTTYVCYHPDLLAGLGFDSPSWKTFGEQNAYLEKVTAKLPDSGMLLPGTHFSSMELLDHFGPEMLSDFGNSGISQEAFVRKYLDPVRQCTSYWSRFGISAPGQAQQHLDNFVSKKTPFLFTNSAQILHLQEQHPGLQFSVYPVLSIEGRLPRITVPLSIVKTTPYLAECVRLLHSLQASEVQKQLAEAGYIPVDQSCYSSLPSCSAEFQGAAERFLVQPEEFYVGINILNVELWNIVLMHRPVEDALKNAFVFARAYLEYQLDMKAVRQQKERGRFYLSK